MEREESNTLKKVDIVASNEEKRGWLSKRNQQNCKKCERDDTALSHQQSKKHPDQEGMASSAFANIDNLCS